MGATLARHASLKPLPVRACEPSDGDAVHGYSVVSTDVVIFEALEADRGHSGLASVPGLARTVTRPLPGWIAALAPGSEYRVVAADAWKDASVESAREMILEAYPAARLALEAGAARWDGGNLVTDLANAGWIVSGA